MKSYHVRFYVGAKVFGPTVEVEASSAEDAQAAVETMMRDGRVGINRADGIRTVLMSHALTGYEIIPADRRAAVHASGD
ncbi:MAG: hypothetical protein QM758_09650 [Armatimonas sp.]